MSSSGVTSESIGAGGTPAYPLATPRTAIATMKPIDEVTNPNAAVISASPASAGISTARRPRRSVAWPAGYSTASSVAVAIASPIPTPPIVSPTRSLVPNSGTSVLKIAPIIHR